MNSRLLILLIPLFCFLQSCHQNDEEGDIECDPERFFLPENLLDWLPYYSNQGLLSDWGFNIEENRYYVQPFEITFFSEDQDTLTLSLSEFRNIRLKTFEDFCKDFQRIDYAFTGIGSDRFFRLGLSVDERNPDNNQLYINACEQTEPGVNGGLSGDCAVIVFDFDYHEDVFFYDELELGPNTYQDVYEFDFINRSITVNIPDYESLFYIKRGIGIVGFRYEGKLWFLN